MIIGNTTSHDGDVLGNNSLPQSEDNDIWLVKLDFNGDFVWQQCFGGTREENIDFGAIKKDSENYILAGHSNVATGDVQCELHSYLGHKDFWVFEIKDCSLYAPQTPSQPTGPDTLCYTNDSTSTYSISAAAKAWGYEWKIEPESAGNLIEDSLLAYVEWNQQYEGEVSVFARSNNDCGTSEWSEAKETWVYNCVGMEEIGSGNVNIRVYPNPAKNLFVVRCSLFGVKDASIQVFDVLGQRVEDIKIPKGQDKTEIDVSHWQKGLYFVKARFEDGGFGCVKVVVE
ncbi:MAG: T9SS type A sorting domain-containing protein [Bacteroidota bacterium]|nr:T9SS type A sorting domain-containing protein [Bacteroidota bacterium]